MALLATLATTHSYQLASKRINFSATSNFHNLIILLIVNLAFIFVYFERVVCIFMIQKSLLRTIVVSHSHHG